MQIFNLFKLLIVFAYLVSFVHAESVTILTGDSNSLVYVNAEQQGSGEIVKLDLQPGVYFFKVSSPEGNILFEKKATVKKEEFLTLSATEQPNKVESKLLSRKSVNRDDLLKRQSWYGGFFLSPVGGFSIGKSMSNQFATWISTTLPI